jgi:hypothetical protein
MALESRMRLTSHVRFGGGPLEKGLVNRYLAGGLPNVTYGSVRAQG